MTSRKVQTPCSRYFSFADLIECGETWHDFQRRGGEMDNFPKEVASWDAIAALAATILDRVYEHFGAIDITYGFAGPELTRQIHGRISPFLDQHAGMELNRSGTQICRRGGQSCDFNVPNVDSFHVARWIHQSLSFDRMYLYGASRSIHISYGPERTGKVYAMVRRSNRVVPSQVLPHTWAALPDLFSRL